MHVWGGWGPRCALWGGFGGPYWQSCLGGGEVGEGPLCALWGFGVPFGGSLGSSMGSLGSPIRPILGSPMGRRGRGLQWWLGVVVLHPPPPFYPMGQLRKGICGGGPVVPYGVFPQSQWVGGVGELGYLTGGAWGRPLFTMGVVGPPSATEGVWGSPVVLWGEGGDLESLTSLCFIGGSWGSYGIFGVPLWGSWGLPKGVFGPPPQGG